MIISNCCLDKLSFNFDAMVRPCEGALVEWVINDNASQTTPIRVKLPRYRDHRPLIAISTFDNEDG